MGRGQQDRLYQRAAASRSGRFGGSQGAKERRQLQAAAQQHEEQRASRKLRNNPLLLNLSASSSSVRNLPLLPAAASCSGLLWPQDGTTPLELRPRLLLQVAERKRPWQHANESPAAAASSLTAFFNTLRADGRLFDVTIACGEQSFRCHSAVLAAKSEYWRTQLPGGPWARCAARAGLHRCKGPGIPPRAALACFPPPPRPTSSRRLLLQHYS